MNPNSLVTRLRWALGTWIQPTPDPGEAWCIRCSINGGRHAILVPGAERLHAEEHGRRGARGEVTIISAHRRA